MKYQLFYRHHLIATVEETHSEFPSCFGRYQLESIADVPDLAHVQAYIDFCIRVSPLREQDCFDEPALAEEELFTDLIESPNWSLIETKTHQRTPILIPVFFTDGGRITRIFRPMKRSNHTPRIRRKHRSSNRGVTNAGSLSLGRLQRWVA